MAGGPALRATPDTPVIEQILPSEVVAVEAFGDDPDATLFPAETAVVGRAAGKRRREFTTARACARAALGLLGIPPVPILPGERGAPQWPDGVTGSITHCTGFRAAAVARTGDVAALGVDAEPDKPLPDGVLDMIASDRERAHLARLSAADPGVCWERLLFSAKESVYKAWFPLTRRWLDFTEAEVTFDRTRHVFTASLLVPAPLSEMRGRWMSAHGLLTTAVVLSGELPAPFRLYACREVRADPLPPLLVGGHGALGGHRHDGLGSE